ncbi:hypothetical protein [Chelativorans sp. M5D2P16]|uniref:hypothetical protein n=1 Tax=Chelativorans sp. M5D2P16 TaxID=3095678 RepID=UPI002ACAC6AC|nr:hypothetical protein [Chelativorans sp. M5D2P16]MDZ5698737.1 hypothetical protein [Chelativorans sp. M5D2P16]
MDNVTTIGPDIAKSVFQVHGVDAVGQGVIRRKLPAGACWGSCVTPQAALPHAAKATKATSRPLLSPGMFPFKAIRVHSGHSRSSVLYCGLTLESL